MSLFGLLDNLVTRARLLQKLSDEDAPSLEVLDARCKVDDVQDQIVALFMKLEGKIK